MNFFEYLFCRLYWWNTEIIKEKVTPLFYSILGLSVFHTYTIVPLYNIAFVLIYKTYYLEEILALSPYFIINVIFFSQGFSFAGSIYLLYTFFMKEGVGDSCF